MIVEGSNSSNYRRRLGSRGSIWEGVAQAGIEAGLTQEQVGVEADMRLTYISILELGQQQPSLASVFKLACALNISPGKLIDLVEREISASGRRRT